MRSALLPLTVFLLAGCGEPERVLTPADGESSPDGTVFTPNDTAETDGTDGTGSIDGLDGTDATDPSDGTGSTDGTDGAATIEPGVYQGTLTFTRTTDAAVTWSGKLGVKVRDDFVFSGTGTASAEGEPAASIKVTGFIDAGHVDGTLELTLAGSDPVELPLSGTGAAQALALTFTGGTQSNKLQGTASLTRTGD